MFFTNLLNALPGSIAQGLIWGIMAIGVYLTFRVLDVADLTVDGSFATGGAVCVILITNGWNPWLSVLCAFVAGMLAGLITGILHTRFGIPAILSGILTQLSLYSINLRIMGKRANTPVNATAYNLIVSSRYNRDFSLNNPILIVLLFLLVIIAFLYWFFGTELGCSIRATGSNQRMAQAQGINTRFNIVLGLMLSNGLVALSGALFAQYTGSADINMGRGAIVIGLAAVIIGEVIFSKIFKSFALKLTAAVIGSIIYYIVIQVVLLIKIGTFKFNTNDLKLLTAAIVAIFLGIPYWKSQLFNKKKTGGKR